MKLSSSKYEFLKYDYCDVILKRDGSITVKFLNLNTKLLRNTDALLTELKLVKENLQKFIYPLIKQGRDLYLPSVSYRL